MNWRFIALTAEKVGAWEPTYDVALWQRENRLHMLYQALVLGQESSSVSVLEWDSQRISRRRRQRWLAQRRTLYNDDHGSAA